jgi:hypothetical protein
MRITLEVVMTDATRQLETVPADLVAWEAYSGKTVTSWADEPPSFTDVAFLAYRCATRGDADRADFIPWLDQAGVLDITLSQVEKPNPTQPEPGAG